MENFKHPLDTDPPRFYCNFKIHKDQLPGETPPIISGSGSSTENIGKFVEQHIRNKAKSR